MKSQLQKTDDSAYTDSLVKKQSARWKQLLNVQAPYRWNIQRINPGFVLDIGCGIGRNLLHLRGNGVGIDHNPKSVEIARQRGLNAFIPEVFDKSKFNKFLSYDSIILAHVAEHMHLSEAVELLGKYLPYLKSGGKLIIITPQEAGYRSDSSHIEFMDFPKLRNIHRQLNLRFTREYSFPFPRFFGRIFKYNEFVSISTKS